MKSIGFGVCLFFFLIFFIYLAVPGLSCSMWDLVPDQGSNPDPLHWEHGVLATGPPGKSLGVCLKGTGQLKMDSF